MQAGNEGAQRGDPEDRTASVGIRVALPHEQGTNPFVEEAYSHQTFFTRLHHFVRLSDAYVVVPGGIGTTLETVMVWQLLQVNHLKPVPLVLVGTMWENLVLWARDHMTTTTPPLASAQDIAMPQCVDSVEAAIKIVKADLERSKNNDRKTR
jgi:predicted Rossmann-fold nucleotide-binding protein